MRWADNFERFNLNRKQLFLAFFNLWLVVFLSRVNIPFAFQQQQWSDEANDVEKSNKNSFVNQVHKIETVWKKLFYSESNHIFRNVCFIGTQQNCDLKKLNHFQMLTGVLTTRPWQLPADSTKNNQLIRFFNVSTKTRNNQLIRFC